MATSREAEEVKVLGLTVSPFVVRVRIALNLKGVQYEFLEEQFGNKSELLIKSNPVYKKMPVLIHEGRPICESMIIVEYVDQVWADDYVSHSILPSLPYDRAVARFWAHYIDDKWFPKLVVILKGGDTEEAHAEAAEEVKAGLKLMEEVLEKHSKGKPFFGGDAIGHVDIAFGSYWTWILAAEKISGFKLFQQEQTPLLFAWSQNFCLDVAVKDVLPDVDKLVEHAKKFSAWMIQNAAAENN
ncbi:glutathione S-transferase U17-like [Dioscorea cayenensis subsp. rotundata]|uniref:glutathione transferase n=1 Tax=Dioscorea cayennensis subsp. rotundata TaxID=55577 RepID=A0AB40D3V2_DIOCR|nr:glutathione S-transferase U17-like [Dioscorea cayenensis subsp. rotundata]